MQPLSSLVGCSKSNPLVGTEWVAVEVNATDLEVYAYTLLFADETSGVMTYDDFVHESESVNFTYNYIEPNVILTVRGYSISGVLNKDEILFEDLGFGGQGSKFNKAKK